jgi:hypothetical protein
MRDRPDYIKDYVVLTYITEDGFFSWTVIGTDYRIPFWKKTSVELYDAGILDKEIDHEVQMLINDRNGQNVVLVIYQKASNNGKYPSVLYKLKTDVASEEFKFTGTTITPVKVNAVPQKWFSKDAPYNMNMIDNVNFVALGSEKVTSGFWASFTPKQTAKGQQAQYETWFGTVNTRRVYNSSSNWMEGAFKLKGLNGGRMYGGGITIDGSNDADRNYLINLDSGEYKICTGTNYYYGFRILENDLYSSSCVSGTVEAGISKEFFIRDINFVKSMVGVYNLVNRTNGELSSGIMNPKNMSLPEIDVSKSLAAASQEYMAWVDKELGTAPLVKYVLQNSTDQTFQFQDKKRRAIEDQEWTEEEVIRSEQSCPIFE